MQPADDIEAQPNPLDDPIATVRVQPSAVRGQADDQMGRGIAAQPGARHRRFEIGVNRDAIRPPVEEFRSIFTGMVGVYDRYERVAPAAAHQTMSGLAVRGAKGSFTIDDRVAFRFGHGYFFPVRMAT